MCPAEARIALNKTIGDDETVGDEEDENNKGEDENSEFDGECNGGGGGGGGGGGDDDDDDDDVAEWEDTLNEDSEGNEAACMDTILGFGVYPLLGHTNHSCMPNCIR